MNQSFRNTVTIASVLSLVTASCTTTPDVFPGKLKAAGVSIACHGEPVPSVIVEEHTVNPFAHVVSPETEAQHNTFTYAGRTFELVSIEASEVDIKTVENSIPRFYQDFAKALEKSGISPDKVNEIITYLSNYPIPTSIVLVGPNAMLSADNDMGLFILPSIGEEAYQQVTGRLLSDTVTVGSLVQDELAIRNGIHDAGFSARTYHFSQGSLLGNQELLAISIHTAEIAYTNRNLIPFAPELLTQDQFSELLYSVVANELYSEAWRTLSEKYPNEYVKLITYLLDKWGFNENCSDADVAQAAARGGLSTADIYGEAGSTAFSFEILEQKWLELTKQLQSLELKLLKALSSVNRGHLNQKRAEILKALGFAQKEQRKNEELVEKLHQNVHGAFWAIQLGQVKG